MSTPPSPHHRPNTTPSPAPAVSGCLYALPHAIFFWIIVLESLFILTLIFK